MRTPSSRTISRGQSQRIHKFQRRKGKEAAKGTAMDTVTDTEDTDMDTDAALQKAIDEKFAAMAMQNRGTGGDEDKPDKGGQDEGMATVQTVRKLSNTKMKILGFNPRKKGGNGADRNGALGGLTAQTRRLALDKKGFINVLKTHKLFANAAALPTSQV